MPSYPVPFAAALSLITEPVFPLLHFLPFRTRSSRLGWQARRVSNPQPAVLETAALPIELLAFLPAGLAGAPAPPSPSALRTGANAWICLPKAPRASRAARPCAAVLRSDPVASPAYLLTCQVVFAPVLLVTEDA